MDFQPFLLEILQLHMIEMYKGASRIANGQERLEIINIEDTVLISLAEICKDIFASEPILLTLHGPIIVVGDLHGHILDLYRILTQFGLPPTTTYLFLGDFVDRGSCSLETITLLFVLKALYPNYVYLIRGNHEFEKTNILGGFFQEISVTYINTSIFDAFISAFDQLPLAATIGSVLCIHGGISPGFTSLSQIASLQRPIHTIDDSIVCGLTWSDPSEDILDFISSPRGAGFYFGPSPFHKFLEKNHLSALIRGHECVSGIKKRFKNRCISVFSASYYCGITPNNAGVILVHDDIITPFSLPALDYLTKDKIKVYKRNEATELLAILPEKFQNLQSFLFQPFSLMSELAGNLPQLIENDGMRRRVKIRKSKNTGIRKSRSLEEKQLSNSCFNKPSIKTISLETGLIIRQNTQNHHSTKITKLAHSDKIEVLDFIPTLKDLCV